ncbi:MAG: hypothetical protein AAF366_05275 [Pseudomonadota bacterium]
MTDRSDLSGRLRRLAKDDDIKASEPGTAAGRIIARVPTSHGDADTVLRAILQTIDDTILPARSVLSSDAGPRLSLSIAARRLRAVEAASEDLAPGDLPGQALEPEDTDAQAELAALIRRFAEGARGPVVVSEGQGASAGGRGLSVARLTEQWAPAPDNSDRPIVDRFVGRCGSRLKACLIRPGDGGPDRLIGDGEMRDMLDGLAGMVEPTVAGGSEGPTLSLWLRQTGAPDGTAFGLARWPGEDGLPIVAVLALATADAGAVSAIFRAIQAD